MNKILLLALLFTTIVLEGKALDEKNYNGNIYFHPVEEIYVDALPKSIMDLEFVHSVSKLPIVFRGAAKNWEAMNWTPESLEEKGLRGLTEAMNNPSAEAERVIYGLEISFWKGQRTIHLSAGTRSHIDQLKEIFEDVNYYEKNLYKDVTEKDLKLLEENTDFNFGRYAFIKAYGYYILGGGKGFEMEIFHNHETAILAEFYGERMVFLIQPHSLEKENELIQSTNEIINDRHHQTTDPILDIKNTNYSPFQQVILKPGDILYIPSGWYHRVHYLTPCLGTTQAINIDDMNQKKTSVKNYRRSTIHNQK